MAGSVKWERAYSAGWLTDNEVIHLFLRRLLTMAPGSSLSRNVRGRTITVTKVSEELFAWRVCQDGKLVHEAQAPLAASEPS